MLKIGAKPYEKGNKQGTSSTLRRDVVMSRHWEDSKPYFQFARRDVGTWPCFHVATFLGSDEQRRDVGHERRDVGHEHRDVAGF